MYMSILSIICLICPIYLLKVQLNTVKLTKSTKYTSNIHTPTPTLIIDNHAGNTTAIQPGICMVVNNSCSELCMGGAWLLLQLYYVILEPMGKYKQWTQGPGDQGTVTKNEW